MTATPQALRHPHHRQPSSPWSPWPATSPPASPGSSTSATRPAAPPTATPRSDTDDHADDHATGGPTTATNGQGLCEHCNHTKQAPGWRARPINGPPDQPHTIETTLPTGHTTTDPPHPRHHHHRHCNPSATARSTSPTSSSPPSSQSSASRSPSDVASDDRSTSYAGSTLSQRSLCLSPPRVVTARRSESRPVVQAGRPDVVEHDVPVAAFARAHLLGGQLGGAGTVRTAPTEGSKPRLRSPRGGRRTGPATAGSGSARPVNQSSPGVRPSQPVVQLLLNSLASSTGAS